MEELTEILEADLAVSAVPNDPMRKHPRFALYKIHKKSDQEERRRKLLEEQKKKRSELFNAGRGLIGTLEENDNSDAMDCSSSRTFSTFHRMYKDILMLSEWLVEVPADLEQEWYMVPCPQGHRSTVVAIRDKTMSFTKAGYNTATFKSLLPGGSSASQRGSTKLDCIWSSTDKTYYILDVLFWGRQSVLNCETEFRFYWLKTKLQEMQELGTRCKENPYVFKHLPYYKCTKDTITEVMANVNMFSNEGPKLDGLLFYHSKTHYTSGLTPLVGWLKPYMMTEMLGIQVAAPYMDCEKKRDIQLIRNKKKLQAEAKLKMDTSDPVECDTTDPGMMHSSLGCINKTEYLSYHI